MSITTKRELLLEYTKCAKKPAYTIESYFETFDMTQNGFVPFKLFEGQKTLIQNYEDNRYNLVLKYRQAGISTVTAAYSAVKTAFAPSNNPERILILANKLETAIEFLNKIVEFIKQLPDWVNITFDKSSQKHVKLSNGSQLKAVATSPDALRGYTPTIMILDEAAFIDGGQALWSACLAAISTGGKAFLISTPNGLDEIYYKTYESAINKTNKFFITHLKWWRDPRFNKDLKLIKTDDVVDWFQKPDDEKYEEVIEDVLTKFSFEEISELLQQGYRPHSTWYENMCREMNLNKRMINQELECFFNGSGDNVIDSSVIKKQEQNNVKEPSFKDRDWENNVWIWSMPQKGHRYILAVDPSRGDSEDYTGLCIIDYDTYEQVLEYHGRIPPDVTAQLVDHYGRMYNALSTFDITGGMGIATTSKLKDLNYPKNLLHYDKLTDNPYELASDSDIPGINFASKNRRSQIVAALEEAVSRGDFKIRSQRCVNEMKKFIYKNGKPEHAKGSHDDLIFALGMCLFVANTSFKKLSNSDDLTKAMLDSWKVNVNIPTTNKTYIIEDNISTRPEPGKVYHPSNDNNNILQNTRDFSWLFGNIKKR